MSRILLVDDDVDLAELVKTKLTAEGHETFTIHTGEGAFEMAKKVKPDIAILDIMLPGITGYQICRKIRKDPEIFRTAILILTALGEEPEILHGIDQGADDYLVKPFKLDRLMEKISSLGQLLQTIESRNKTTRLPGTDAIKREINHRLARGVPIAAIYIDIAGFKPYCAAKGPEGMTSALEYMAKVLMNLRRNVGFYESYLAHMGGEHFVALVNLEDYERFCNSMIDLFQQHRGELYSKQELDRGYILAKDRNGNDVRCPLMALSIGVAHNQYRQVKSAKKIFEILAQVRQMAQPKDGQSAVFVDRRHSDR